MLTTVSGPSEVRIWMAASLLNPLSSWMSSSESCGDHFHRMRRRLSQGSAPGAPFGAGAAHASLDRIADTTRREMSFLDVKALPSFDRGEDEAEGRADGFEDPGDEDVE